MKHVTLGPWKKAFEGTTYIIEAARATTFDKTTKTIERATKASSIEVIALDKQKRILLSYEYKIQQKKYVLKLPTGTIQFGETPKQAAIRELMEETGYKPSNIRLFRIVAPTTSLNQTHYVFIATNLKPHKIYAEEESEIKIIPTALNKVYSLIKQDKICGGETSYTLLKFYWANKKRHSKKITKKNLTIE